MTPWVKSHHLPGNAETKRRPKGEGYLVLREQSNEGHPVIRKFFPISAKSLAQAPSQPTQDSHKATSLVGDADDPYGTPMFFELLFVWPVIQNPISLWDPAGNPYLPA